MIAVVVGATGTGKSAFSLRLAERIAARGGSAEIVNADAMQLYRGMDIGTAKLRVQERAGVPHHLLDELEVTEEASVAWYQRRARAVVADILHRGAVPILVGGSGLYVSSVLYEFDFPERDPEVRAQLEAELERSGPGLLHRQLAELDPAAAEAIGPHNGRRIVRALEVIQLTGRPFTPGLPEEERMWRPAHLIGLQTPRERLVPRLDERVEGMWRDGLVEEVRGLVPRGLERGVTARKAIGYAQALGQLRGELTEREAIDATAALTRRYARRQASWFRRYAGIRWTDADDPAAVDAALERSADALARPVR